MRSDDVLVFDIAGEYGHFRKFNTTTSPLTYPIPPRSAILGMIGAILGIERETGIGKYKEGQTPLSNLLDTGTARIAVQLLNPVNKVNMAFNLVNTKTSFFNIDNRTQIEYELLKNPAFRIFLQWDNSDLSKKLERSLSDQHAHFTLNLGLSQLLAQVSYVDRFQVRQEVADDFVEVISAIKLDLLNTENPIDFKKGEARNFKYLSDTYPNVLTPDRLVAEFAEIMVEAKGNPIEVRSKHVYSVERLGNILFL